MSETAYYTIKGVSPSLDGLEAKVVLAVPPDYDGYSEVLSLRNRGVLIGDRPWSVPVAPGSLLIKDSFLIKSEYQDEMQFTSLKPPYGEHRYDAKLNISTYEVAYSEFENAVTVVVYDVSVEPKKTLYSQNFFDDEALDNVDYVLSLIDDFKNGLFDPDELVFKLKEIHDGPQEE